jgi:hypothetical protein
MRLDVCWLVDCSRSRRLTIAGSAGQPVVLPGDLAVFLFPLILAWRGREKVDEFYLLLSLSLPYVGTLYEKSLDELYSLQHEGI